MQQPLCHLYFLTLLEHLIAQPQELNSLVRLVGVVGQWCEFDHLSPRHKLVLHIEKQAVIQVIIQRVAELFTQRNHVITNSVSVSVGMCPHYARNSEYHLWGGVFTSADYVNSICICLLY